MHVNVNATNYIRCKFYPLFQGKNASASGERNSEIANSITETSKKERIELFYRKLGCMPQVSNPMQAYHQISTAMKEVEYAFSNQPYDPVRRFEQERMYPLIPPEESLREVSSYPGIVCLPSKGHDTFLSRNGAIEIQSKSKNDPRPYSGRFDKVCFRKAGADGYFVWEDALSHSNVLRSMIARFWSGSLFRKNPIS